MPQPSSVTVEDVVEALRQCYDPCCRDREISVVDMGLIEEVRVDAGTVHIDMLLTSGWCPFVANLYEMIEEHVTAYEGVESVEVEVVWEPVWTMDRLSDSAREKLRLPMEKLLPYREQRIAAQERGG